MPGTEPTDSPLSEVDEMPSAAIIFGRTSAMCDVRAKVENAFQSPLPVLIQGESGTGKELIGRFLHAHSELSGGRFVKLSCAAVPVALFEGELFGYEKGAYPGVTESRKGALETAAGGSIFLDEISEMDDTLQAKFALFLKSRRFSRRGGQQELVSQVRMICSTDKDPEDAVADHALREELLSGLSVIRLRLSPLRERREDIPELCEYLIEKLSRNFGKSVPRLSDSALETLKQWKWPGNMRELENWVARIVIFGTEEVLGLEFRRQLAAISVASQDGHRVSRFGTGVLRRVHRLRRE
jgi:transcriptional regulator with PAS, ATPase and Fis domain